VFNKHFSCYEINCHVFLTKSVGSANTDAGIDALLAYASFVLGTFAVGDAFWSAVGRMVDETRLAGTDAGAVDGTETAVGTALLSAARLLWFYIRINYVYYKPELFRYMSMLLD